MSKDLIEQKALLYSDDDDNDDKMLTIKTDTKLSRVQGQVNDVIDDMKSNIQKVADRGQNLNDLSGRSEELGMSADAFNRRSKNLRKSMWLRTCRARLYLATTISFVLVLMICNSDSLSILILSL